jgi:hypothetical protein
MFSLVSFLPRGETVVSVKSYVFICPASTMDPNQTMS